MPAVSPALEPPPGNPRFVGVDGLRGVAILLVLVCHTSGITGLWTKPWGWVGLQLMVGVVLFFAISGFLLYRPFVAAHRSGGDGPGAARYARRRVLRIVPAYWVALTVLAVWPGIPGVFDRHWWTSYLLVQDYDNATLVHGLGITWSLCCEVAFYALLPFYAAGVMALTRRLRRPWWQVELAGVAALAVAGLVAAVLAYHSVLPAWMANALPTTIAWFAGGMALAVLSVAAQDGGWARRLQDRIAARAVGLWVAALVVWLVGARCVWAMGLEDVARERAHLDETVLLLGLRWACYGVAATLVLAPVVAGAGGAVRRVTRWRPLALLGTISYGFYLWHYTIAWWLHGGNPAIDGGAGAGVHGFWLLTITAFVASVAVATVSYRVVELPFLRRKEGPVADAAPVPVAAAR